MSNGITKKAILLLVESQEFKCALTGRELTPDTAAVDHRVPLTKGGLHSIDNLWVVHAEVNRAKGTMDVADFVAMCRDVVRFSDGG